MKHKLKSPALAIVLMLALLGCSKNPALPAGAVNVVDNQIYSSLITAQAAIEEAKNQLPALPTLKAPLNEKIIPAYNIAWHAFADYHAALVAGTPPDAATEQKLITQIAAVAAGLQAAIATAKVTK